MGNHLPTDKPGNVVPWRTSYQHDPCHFLLVSFYLKQYLLPEIVHLILRHILPKRSFKDTYSMKYSLASQPNTPKTDNIAQGIVILKNDTILATANSNLYLFSLQGNFISSWGTESEETIRQPLGLAQSRNGNVLVVDLTPHRQIQVRTQEGRFLFKFTNPINHIWTPWGITENSLMDIYVTSKNTITVFDKEGVYKSTIISDKAKCNFRGITIGLEDSLYVCDNGRCCVQVFNKEGEWLRDIGLGKLSYTWYCVVDDFGRMAVTDFGNGRVAFFEMSGEFVSQIAKARKKGEEYRPVGLTLDRYGNLYVGDHDSRDYIECFG